MLSFLGSSTVMDGKLEHREGMQLPQLQVTESGPNMKCAIPKSMHVITASPRLFGSRVALPGFHHEI